jgi:DivIVA domain-containing protein
MAEELPPISSAAPPASPPRLSPADVTRRSFGTVRRGFDPHEVAAYLQLIAQELSAWDRWDQEQQKRIADAEERAANPEIDETRLTAALGQRSAQVLRNAHDEAARLLQAAEENATALTREAQQQATEIQVAAEAAAAERIAEAEFAATALRQQVQTDVTEILEAARLDGDALLARARERGRVMLEQAQEARRRMGLEMSQRRRALLLQIEQLRAARDQLARSVLGVRGTVDDIVNGLARADDDARAAAAAVAQRQVVEIGERDPGALPAAASEAAAPDESPEDEEETDEGASDEAETEAPITTGISVGELDIEVRPPPAGREPDGDPSADEAAAENGGADGDDDPGDGSPMDDLASDSRVEELFARIRAGHDPGDATGTERAVSSAVRTAAVDTESVDADSAEVDDAENAETADAEGIDGGEGPHVSPADERLLGHRSALLDPIVARLARRLKRSLQDDQNQLLHRLRNSPAGARDLLISEDEQRKALAGAAGGFLAEAFDAGVTFARAHGEAGTVSDRAPIVDQSLVGDSADGLAGTVVTLLRRRLLGEEGGSFGTDPEEAVERVSAAYREWRGERIERLVGDHALGAFSSGVLASMRTTAGVRWVLGGSGAACADCDDNALADLVKSGERFPTGHRHPPAHAGCRCLVVPTRA